MTKPAKYTTFFAVAMVLLFGLCSVGAMNSTSGNGWSANMAILAGAGCVICLVGMIGCFIWMLVARKTQ